MYLHHNQMKTITSVCLGTWFAGVCSLAIPVFPFDQEQNENGLNIATLDMAGLAQSFKPAVANINGAGIYLFPGVGTPGPITISLWQSFPQPWEATPLAQGTFDPGAVGSSEGWVDVFWDPVFVTPNMTLFLSFSSQTDLALAGGQVGWNNQLYENGEAFSWSTPYPEFDYAFHTFTDPLASVPDSGSTSMLLGISLAGVIAFKKAKARNAC